ncbi:hypothetical protein EYF80_044960 [Liparis tanakae]|uniref:Uncharacterized protein n=1 Tax=Liparis tanakae TaxID=230148 RepID=A0A4Z2FWY1_9TELE|nr:hypothetical protein EYF80_044960 [Liparis tanakae]
MAGQHGDQHDELRPRASSDWARSSRASSTVKSLIKKGEQSSWSSSSESVSQGMLTCSSVVLPQAESNELPSALSTGLHRLSNIRDGAAGAFTLIAG